VGVCLDAGHSRSNFQDPAEEARAAGARLFAVHLQDNHGSGGDEHLVPVRDMAGWDRLMKTLDELGYSGGRMFEIHGSAGTDPDGTLRQLAELVRRWGDLGRPRG
jgi:sugar phosphate isomerase/epimerase